MISYKLDVSIAPYSDTYWIRLSLPEIIALNGNDLRGKFPEAIFELTNLGEFWQPF
jgi:hypothetical protein